MKRYRVRDGSIADIGRHILLAVAFWAAILWAMVTTYPV